MKKTTLEAGGSPVSPVKKQKKVVAGANEGSVFGLSSLKGKMQPDVFAEVLLAAMGIQARVIEQQNELSAAQLQAERAQNRADILERDLKDSITKRLIDRGHIDLRGILTDVLPGSKKSDKLEAWLGKKAMKTFCARCKKEPKIKADNNGNKVTAEYLALRLSALWGRACSDVHPDVNAQIWAQMNVNRVVPLERWLTDATDLLLVYHLLDVNSYPVQRPRVITSTPAEA